MIGPAGYRALSPLLGTASCSAILLTTLPAAAQQPELLTAVPESPALSFLGASPARVMRPGSVRDLGVALLTGVDERGRPLHGFALDATPWIYLPGLHVSLRDYRERWLMFVLANAQLSAGAVRAAGEEGATNAALGLRLTLWDGTDPMRRRGFTRPVAAGLRECTAEPETTTAAIAACADSVMRAASAAFGEWAAEHWNARRAAIGVATGVRLTASELDRAAYAGTRLWLVGANPVGHVGQLIGQLSYRRRTGAGDQPADELGYGLRLVAGSATFNLFAEAVGQSDRGDDRGGSGAWSGGIELRIARDLWVSTGFGARFGTLDEPGRVVVLADIRWGISRGTRLDGLRQ